MATRVSRSLLDKTFRRKLFIYCIAVLLCPMFVYMAYSAYELGRSGALALFVGFNLFIVCSVALTVVGRGLTVLPRLNLLLGIGLISFIVIELARVNVFYWYLIIPLMSMFVFGWREGLAWSIGGFVLAAVLILQLPDISGTGSDDVFFIYAIVTLFSATFDWMREGAQKIAFEQIDELRASEEARRQGEAALAQSNKMQALGQLTSGVAHDFNNLLMVVRGNLELAQHGGDEKGERLADAIAASDSATQLIDKLLTFSRTRTLLPKVIDANDTVRSVMNLLERSIGENVEIKSRLSAELWRCKVDPTELENCLINLAVNSRDAMPEGGTLRINTSNLTYSESGAEKDAQDFICIRVSDTGTGIADSIMDKVFEPFFTTKEAGAGTGLGLSTVHGFVGQSGGKLLLDSAPEKGTSFSILLPRTKEPLEEASETRQAEDIELDGLLVLVLEDNERVARTVEEMLRSEGCEVCSADNSSAAMELLKRRAPDLVLVDIVLAERKTGLHFADEARSSFPAMPVLFMSGYAKDGLGARELPRDATVLTKPFSKQSLCESISRVMATGTK